MKYVYLKHVKPNTYSYMQIVSRSFVREPSYWFVFGFPTDVFIDSGLSINMHTMHLSLHEMTY